MVSLSQVPKTCHGCNGTCCRDPEFVTGGLPPWNEEERRDAMLVMSIGDQDRIRYPRGEACVMLAEDGLCRLKTKYGRMPSACVSFQTGGDDCLRARSKAGVE